MTKSLECQTSSAFDRLLEKKDFKALQKNADLVTKITNSRETWQSFQEGLTLGRKAGTSEVWECRVFDFLIYFIGTRETVRARIEALPQKGPYALLEVQR